MLAALALSVGLLTPGGGAPPAGPIPAEPPADDVGSITAVLDARPDSGTDHTIRGCGPFGCADFTLDDDTDPTHGNQLHAPGLPPATYTLTATPAPGHTTTDITCTTGEQTNPTTDTATITLHPGEHPTCTFTVTPDPTPEPVVLVHGFNAGPQDFDQFVAWLEADGVPADRIFAFWYDTRQSNVTIAQALGDYVTDFVLPTTGADEIDLVSHSMGSLSSRWCVRFGACAGLVDDFVSVAGANHGTTWAYGCFLIAGGPGCAEMQPESSFLAQLNQGDETPGDAAYTTYRSECDAVIAPVTSTVLAGADNVVSSCVSHTGLLSDRPTYDAARDTLLQD